MEERILGKSEQYNLKRGLLTFFVIIAVIGVFCILGSYFITLTEAKRALEEYPTIYGNYSSPAERAWSWSQDERWVILGIVAGIGIICPLIYLWLRSCEMTVTNRRIYGKAAFGKRVDLPVDSVSAIGSSWPKGVSVSTSSGRISFLMIKNRDEIHKCVSDLLIERQSKPTVAPVTSIKQEIPMSNAEELKKYKELLDIGVISQEEFNAKKKQLLGL